MKNFCLRYVGGKKMSTQKCNVYVWIIKICPQEDPLSWMVMNPLMMGGKDIEVNKI